MLTVGQMRIVRRAEREVGEASAGNTMGQVGLTPDVTYIGDIWRESKLLLCLLQFGPIHLGPSLYNSELLERD